MARLWADVAELTATQGLKGRLVARPVRGLPFLLEEGMEVFFVPPTLEGPRRVRVKRVQHEGDNSYLVEFTQVKAVATAEMLVGSHCLVDVEDLPEGFERMADDYADQFIGWLIHDEASGFTGEIIDVEYMPTQDLLIVAPIRPAHQLEEDVEMEGQSGLVAGVPRAVPRDENVPVTRFPKQDCLSMECPPQDPTDNPVYIPFVDDFIVEFDEDAQIIAMSLPGGLVDEGARA